MKIRWLAMSLVLFLLWGCEAPPESESLPATEPEVAVVATVPTVPSGLFLPDSFLESVTAGAVRSYSLPSENARAIRFLEQDILIFSESVLIKLTGFSDHDYYISAQVALPGGVSPDQNSVAVKGNQVVYLDSSSVGLVFLDSSLERRQQIPLTNVPTGAVTDGNQVYYCTDTAIRAMDPATGIDRLLKEMSFPRQELTGIHFGGTLLECSVTYNDGSAHTLFLSADTGSLLDDTVSLQQLVTDGDFYAAVHRDGSYSELLCGFRNGEPAVLGTEHCKLRAESVFGSRSLVLITEDTDSDETILDYYVLESGQHPFRVALPGNIHPTGFASDPAGKYLWFLYFDETIQRDILCCWSLDQSPTGDCRSYLQPRRSMDSPDIEGLLRCQKLADTISQKHQVRILIWTDALAAQLPDCTPVPEHQVPLIEDSLTRLDTILSCYPAGFLKKAAAGTESGMLSIHLVRAIGDTEEQALSCWDAEGNGHLVITPNESMDWLIFRHLFPFIENRVLCSGTAYDNWSGLNPDGFIYGQNSSGLPELLLGENRAFVSSSSMRSATGDRAEIMAYAMLNGQHDLFFTPIIQTKLRTLCLGIRGTFGSDAPYPWEQYLTEPLP